MRRLRYSEGRVWKKRMGFKPEAGLIEKDFFSHEN